MKTVAKIFFAASLMIVGMFATQPLKAQSVHTTSKEVKAKPVYKVDQNNNVVKRGDADAKIQPQSISQVNAEKQSGQAERGATTQTRQATTEVKKESGLNSNPKVSINTQKVKINNDKVKINSNNVERR